MMFRYSFKLAEEADAIERAVDQALTDGWRTADIAGVGERAIGTRKMGEVIRANI